MYSINFQRIEYKKNLKNSKVLILIYKIKDKLPRNKFYDTCHKNFYCKCYYFVAIAMSDISFITHNIKKKDLRMNCKINPSN